MGSDLVDTIICPRCHVELDVHHDHCPHCQASLSVRAVEVGADENESTLVLNRPWVLVVLLLHVGLLGIPFYWKTHYSTSTRALICLASVAYTVFAVAFIASVGSWLYRQFTGG